ncbi:WYL domain-containing protein [Janthinobacterium sp. 17J80-10]|uniref:helix-turn-helix transcriptional regulator n=1 Tax=Janthinobacterium sp. 17J80-10 TaxID=2497863 RepID=UPI00100569EC|nr:WYL domain-containing protein [Janthinobacterium sp. 17J80-10]QAU35122.1 WYL domain-containing protein [Janthinobacterium sp. 17J80-10]
MDRTERLYRIQTLLSQYRVVPRTKFLEVLGISLATFKRDLAYLRDRMDVPIEYDTEAGGYRLKATVRGGRHELPGMWFNADEIHALLSMQQLLQELQPGLLTPHIQPLLDRLYRLLDSPDVPRKEVQRRIRVLRANAHQINPASFGLASTAVLNRRQITIQYFHRGRNATESRTLSPQRLTYYRDNWYLDAWCHLREDIRSFSLDAIRGIELLDDAALNIPDADLDAVFTAGYGIFSGAELQWAVLRFSPERARWVSRESWHPQQESFFEEDGHYVLRVPYSDDRELLMDILRHVPEVVVLGPSGLQVKVAAQLEKGVVSIKNM